MAGTRASYCAQCGELIGNHGHDCDDSTSSLLGAASKPTEPRQPSAETDEELGARGMRRCDECRNVHSIAEHCPG